MHKCLQEAVIMLLCMNPTCIATAPDITALLVYTKFCQHYCRIKRTGENVGEGVGGPHTCRGGASRLPRCLRGIESQAGPFQGDRLCPSPLLLCLLRCCSCLSICQALLQLSMQLCLRLCLSLCIVSCCFCSLLICLDLCMAAVLEAAC